MYMEENVEETVSANLIQAISNLLIIYSHANHIQNLCNLKISSPKSIAFIS